MDGNEESTMNDKAILPREQMFGTFDLGMGETLVT
jgi:hypothetical protein